MKFVIKHFPMFRTVSINGASHGDYRGDFEIDLPSNPWPSRVIGYEEAGWERRPGIIAVVSAEPKVTTKRKFRVVRAGEVFEPLSEADQMNGAHPDDRYIGSLNLDPTGSGWGGGTLYCFEIKS